MEGAHFHTQKLKFCLNYLGINGIVIYYTCKIWTVFKEQVNLIPVLMFYIYICFHIKSRSSTIYCLIAVDKMPWYTKQWQALLQDSQMFTSTKYTWLQFCECWGLYFIQIYVKKYIFVWVLIFLFLTFFFFFYKISLL